MIPGTVEMKIFVVVIMAIMNIFLLKKNKKQKTNDLVQSYSPNADQDYNINSNKQIINHNQANGQDKYTQKTVHNHIPLNKVLENNGHQLTFKDMDQYFVDQQNSQSINIDRNIEKNSGVYNNLTNEEKLQKSTQNSPCLSFMSIPYENKPNKQRFQLENNFVQNPYHQKQQISSMFQNQVHHLNKSSLLFQKPKSNTNIFSNQFPSNRNIFKVSGPKVQDLKCNQSCRMQLEQSIPQKQQNDNHYNNFKTAKKLKTSHKMNKNLFFSEGQFQKTNLQAQNCQQYSSQGQQADTQTIGINKTLKTCKNCCSNNNTNKRQKSHKQPAKQSFKRCIQELIYTTLQQMVKQQDIQNKFHHKKKKNSM